MELTDVTDLLHTLAEVSIAFVGFSTIVAALRARNDSTFQIYSIRDVAIVGLLALFAALLPLFLQSFLIETKQIWRFSSLIFTVAWLISAVWGIYSYRQAVAPEDRPVYLVVGPVSLVIANPLLWFNIYSPADFSGSIYVLALLLLLLFVAVSFIAATFHKISNI